MKENVYQLRESEPAREREKRMYVPARVEMVQYMVEKGYGDTFTVSPDNVDLFEEREWSDTELW